MKKRKGAAAVELAILLPLLAMLFAAAVDFARVFHATQSLQSAAQAGAASASGITWTPGYPATASSAAIAAALAEAPQMSPAIDASNVTVVISGDNATVTVACDFPMVTTGYSSSTVRLERSATYRITSRPGD